MRDDKIALTPTILSWAWERETEENLKLWRKAIWDHKKGKVMRAAASAYIEGLKDGSARTSGLEYMIEHAPEAAALVVLQATAGGVEDEVSQALCDLPRPTYLLLLKNPDHEVRVRAMLLWGKAKGLTQGGENLS